MLYINIWLWIHLPMQKTQETLFRSLSQEDLLEQDMATCYNILAMENSLDREDWWATVMRSQRVEHDWRTEQTHTHTHTYIYNGIWFSHKKNEIMPFCSNMGGLRDIILSEGSQRKTNIISFIWIGGRRKRGRQSMRWLDGITDLIRHESEWTPGVGDGQGGLGCCNSCGRKESDTTEWLNWTELICAT